MLRTFEGGVSSGSALTGRYCYPLHAAPNYHRRWIKEGSVLLRGVLGGKMVLPWVEAGCRGWLQLPDEPWYHQRKQQLASYSYLGDMYKWSDFRLGKTRWMSPYCYSNLPKTISKIGVGWGGGGGRLINRCTQYCVLHSRANN